LTFEEATQPTRHIGGIATISLLAVVLLLKNILRVFVLTERFVGTKKTGKGRRKIGRKKRRNRARIRHRK